MPTLMKDQLPAEIVYEQIPDYPRTALRGGEEVATDLRIRRDATANGRGPRRRRRSRPPTCRTSPSHAVLKTPSAVEKPKGAATVAAAAISPAAITARSFAPDEAGIVADADSEQLLSRFIERQLLPYLRARRGGKFRLGHAREADDTFRHLKLQVAAPYRLRVEEMQGGATSAACSMRKRACNIGCMAGSSCTCRFLFCSCC